MKNLFLSFLCFIGTTSFSQTANLVEIATIPGAISETSGLEVLNRNRIWTHNDSGNPPLLFEIDSNGAVVRSIEITNASNIDWEEITQDDSGNFYIGDFGNNGNSRQNLRVLKIPNPDMISDSTVAAEIINFSYPDQTAFPPPANEQHFDMEAMFWYGDSLYLFSKNRTNPFDGFTKRYRLPDVAGTYQAVLIDSFYTGPGASFSWWITAADISPDKSKAVLLSHDKMWLFSCFKGANFFGGSVEEIGLGASTQKEAVCFIDNNEIYITDEVLLAGGGKLYRVDLTPFVNEFHVDLGNDTIVNGESFVLDAGVGGIQYLWNNGETTQLITIASTELYWVEVTTSDGCIASDTIQITFSPPSSVGLVKANIPIQVAPNPFSDRAEITIHQATTKGYLSVFDLYGRIVMEKELEPGINHVSFHPDEAQPGIYLIRVLSGSNSVLKKLVKY